MPVTNNQKKFLLKVYKPGKDGEYLGTLDNCTFGSFEKSINGGLGTLTGRAAFKFDEFEFGTIFRLNNQFKIVCIDKESPPEGITIYSGYLESFGSGINAEQEAVEFTLIGNWVKAGLHIAHWPKKWEESGTGSSIMKTSTEYNGGIMRASAYTAASARIDEIVRAAIDYYFAADERGIINYHQPVELYTDPLYNDSTLKGYWRFEEGTGTAVEDAAGSDNDATIINGGSEAEWVDGVFGGAYDFALEDYATVVNHADMRPTGNFTISVWMKCRNSNATARYMFQSWSNTGNLAGIILGVTAAGLVTADSGRNTGGVSGTDFKNLLSTNRIDDEKWHHIVFCWDGATLYLYIDGVLDKKAAWANAPGYAASNYVRIGTASNNGLDDGNYLFDGALDEVALFNGKCLSEGEVLRLFGNKFIKQTNTYLTYTFNTRTIKNIVDRCLEFLPPFWHYFVDAYNRFHLKNKDAFFSKELVTTNLFKKRSSGLGMYYRFEEKSGTTVINEVGSNGTASASSILNNPTSGRFGGAGLFSSAASNAVTPASSFQFSRNDKASFGCWFKMTSHDGANFQTMFSNWQNSGGVTQGFILAVSDTQKFRLMLAGAGVIYISVDLDFKVEVDKWYHVVVTNDGDFQNTNIRMYVNGHIAYTTQITGFTAAAGTYPRVGTVTNDGVTNTWFFNGYIDEVFFWSGKELSQEEVWDLYFDTPKHKFTIGKDVTNVKVSRTMEDVRNNYLLSNGETATLFYRYRDADSEDDFDQLWEERTDGRITVAASADNKGMAFIETNKREKVSVALEVLDSNLRDTGYDIESIEPGDSCMILNFNDTLSRFFDYNDFFITKVTYQQDRVVLQLETLRDSIAKELALVGDRQSEADASDNTQTFTNRPI